MKIKILMGFILAVSGLLAVAKGWPEPPKAKVVAHVDVLHGTKVADPYRWMENEKDPDLKRWIAAQRAYAEQYLSSLPGRDKVQARLKALWNFARVSAPTRHGKYWFQYRNDGLQNQSVLYVMTSSRDTGRVLLDPNKLAADGTVAVNALSISPDGRFVAYALSKAGSDWQTWHVRSVEDGKDLPDRIEWSKFSGAAWLPDGSGFYYARYDAPKPGEALSAANYNQKLYFHSVGTKQSADVLVYERPDQPEWGFSPTVTKDGRFLIIHVWKGTDSRNRLFYKDLRKEDAKIQPLISDLEASYEFIANVEDTLFIKTNLAAPRGRVIAINVNKPEKSHWKTIVPEQAETLRSATLVNGILAVSYLKDARSQLKIYDLSGRFKTEVPLPGVGTASNLIGRQDSDVAFISFTNYVRPTTIYRYDFRKNKLERFWGPKLQFNPDDYVSEQVFYTSQDGTRIPMTISYKKGLKKDGKRPTLLYGYGGFNISILPAFSVQNLVWMELGGVYAVANLRGGSEYGEAWHKAGMKHNKQNVFDDFIAAAEYLISSGYTSPRHLGIYGRSNGGLLVGAVMTQRPELFAAALPAVGVLDMLRFHKFTIGWAWVSEYGSADNADDFPVLYRYSPYHNLKQGVDYPATMVMTADHDDRVVPYHSFKFAARLQAYNSGKNPVIVRIEEKAGHGAGKPTAKRIEEARDIIVFLAAHTGLDLSQK